MATLSYWIDDLERATIPIGFVGENNYRQIIINCKKVFDKYPSLVPTLTVTPPKGDPYPAVVTRGGDNVCWDVQNSDLVYKGNGELQLSFVEYEDGAVVDDGIVAKTYVAKTRIERSILPVGVAPDPIANWLVQANAALGAIPQTILDALAAAKASGEFDGEDGVGIQSIEKTSTSGLVDTYTVTLTDESTYVYTVTNGKDGEQGRPGDTGADGVGIRSIEKTGTSGLVDTYTITYTDNSTSTFTVTNGAKGDPGNPGQDGVSPTVTVEDITGGHRVTITDKNGSRTFDVMNGAKGDKGDPGDPSELIDDTNPSATTKTFSANKVSEMNSSLLNALNQKQEKLKVTSLTQTPVASGQVVDSIGIPVYVDDVTDYSAYGITDTGWYSFVRITAKEGVTVSAQTTVTGADGYIATIGADHVDVAVRFGVAAQSKTVTIAWGSNYTESFVFRATDLAVRNLDYRSTFYIYDIADFAEWTWALTTDETFQDGVNYYTESGGEYTLATVTVGDTVPANTYYVHSKLTFSGMIRNVTYRFNEMVDCPIEIVLPEVPDDGYGAWFEIQMQYSKQVSTTLLPTDPTVVIGTATTQAQTAGINVIDLQYSGINEVKMWTLLNTHSNLPTTTSGGA